MGYARAPGKSGTFTFDVSRVYEAVTIRSSACLPAYGEPLALAVGIVPWGVGIPLANQVAGSLAVFLTALALRGALRLRATTLAAPCLWTAIASLCLVITSFFEPTLEGIGLSALRFSMTAMTFCPLMAVLGAKRPQDRGWQWVVLSLWIVLIWPAVQAVLLPVGVRVELFVAWKLFLWGLIGVGLLNYLPTRHWMAALAVAMGQVVLLQAHLGLGAWLSTEWSLVVGVSCLLLAALLMGWRSRPQLPKTSEITQWMAAQPMSLSPGGNPLHPTKNECGGGALAVPRSIGPLDRRWQSFRDAYGAFWALRMLGRINQAAELREWPWRLHWSRFVPSRQQPTAAERAELEQTLTTLLRRFVDDRDR